MDSAQNSGAKTADYPDNSLGGVAVPELRRAGRFPVAIHDSAESVENSALVGSDYDVGAVFDRDRPFGVVAEREAGDT